MGWGALVLLYSCEEVVGISSVCVEPGTRADRFRFTGPKITLSEDELTDEQQEALKTEGLEVNIEPREADEAKISPISKDI